MTSVSMFKKAKQRKYRNEPCTWNGEQFDSRAELQRYLELRALARAGEITELERQPSFVLVPKVSINGKTVRSIIYRADFSYQDRAGKRVIEDVKGMLTPVYKLKRHMMKALLGLDVKEVRK